MPKEENELLRLGFGQGVKVARSVSGSNSQVLFDCELLLSGRRIFSSVHHASVPILLS
jgi:hypothetical protein